MNIVTIAPDAELLFTIEVLHVILLFQNLLQFPLLAETLEANLLYTEGEIKLVGFLYNCPLRTAVCGFVTNNSTVCMVIFVGTRNLELPGYANTFD